MKAKWILIVIALIMIPIVFGIAECQRTQSVTKIPCTVISSWNPGACDSRTVLIYNASGINVANYSWFSYFPVCAFNFTMNKSGTYHYNSTVEDGVITLSGDDNMILLIFIPLGLCFLFLYWAQTLNEEQEPLKWFMRLLSLVMIFLTYGAANILINLSPGYEGLQAVFNFVVVEVIFYTIVAIALLYLLYQIFMSFKNKRKNEFEQGILR